VLNDPRSQNGGISSLELNFPSLSKTFFLIEFVPREAPEDLWETYFTLSETVFREDNKRDRLPDRGALKRFLSTSNPLYKVERWILLCKAEGAIASGWIAFDTELSPDYDSNSHLCQIRIAVVPSYRRKKIATTLLQHLGNTASLMGKDLVMAEVDNPLAVRFCKSLRGELVHEEVQHRLSMEDVDWARVERWLAKGRARSGDIRMELFQECPEDDLEEFSKVYTEIINQRPTGGMEQQLSTTPESRRIEERNLKRRGIEWYTMISREHTGQISGVTDIMYNPEEPHRIKQYFTGVLGKYRSRGLAKRLKAEMLMVIRREFPNVEYVTTNTARTNLPMRSVNRRLGFLPRKSLSIYQWAIGDLRERVDEMLSGLEYSWES
jgi:ribosomal protein S18 acetylase RimI-like enzyme